jgi:acyl-CoA dehydrogenase
VDDGQPARDLPFVRWSCAYAHFQIETALRGVLDNLPNRAAAWGLRLFIFPLGARLRPPSDRSSAAVARSLLSDREARDHLTADIFIPPPDDGSLGRLESAYAKVVAAGGAEKKVKDAARARKLGSLEGVALLDEAFRAGVIDSNERRLAGEAAAARSDAIQVDAFAFEAFARLRR